MDFEVVMLNEISRATHCRTPLTRVPERPQIQRQEVARWVPGRAWGVSAQWGQFHFRTMRVLETRMVTFAQQSCSLKPLNCAL